MIKLVNISKIYHNKNRLDVLALDNINFSFPDRGMYIFIGESGCGKTTILNVIGGLLHYNYGKAYIFNFEHSSIVQKKWDEYRINDIAYTFQENNLFNEMTIYENLSIPLFLQKESNLADKMSSALKSVGLANIDLSRRVYELSSGQKQRIAIARALIKNPKIILADEPTGNLDEKNANSILSIYEEISRHSLVILVSHDINLVKKFSSTIIEMNQGKITSIKDNHLSDNQNEIMIKVDVYSSDHLLESDIIQTDNISQFIHDHQFIEHDVKFILSFIATKPSKARNESMMSFKCRPRKDNSKTLPLQFLAKISLNYTKINSHRFFISSVIITISFLLILFIGSVYFFNSRSTISRYLNETQTKYVIPEFNFSYIDRLNTQIELNVFKGEKLYNSFTEESDNIYRVFSNMKITVTDNSIDQYYYVNYALMDKSTYEYQGASPSSENEVMITDYLYEKLFGLVDDFLFPRYFRDVDGEKKVVGVVITDYTDKNYYNDDLRKFYQEKVYSLVFVNDISSSYFDVNLVDPFGNNYVSFMSQADYDEYESNTLNAGEIAISSAYAKQHNINIGDKVFFLDYSSNENSIKYSNYLDINSLFGDGFTVLNILDTNENIFVLSDSDYKVIYDNYLDYYAIDYFIVFRNEPWNLSKNTFSDFISFEDPVVQIIKEIHAEFSRNKSLFYPLLLLSFTLAILSLFNFVSAILHKKRKEVAIFQTLGVSYQDITRVFIIQGYILGVIGFLIAVPIYLIIMTYVNSTFADISEFGFNIFRANWGAITIIFSSMILLIYIFMKIRIKQITNLPIQNNLYNS